MTVTIQPSSVWKTLKHSSIAVSTCDLQSFCLDLDLIGAPFYIYRCQGGWRNQSSTSEARGLLSHQSHWAGCFWPSPASEAQVNKESLCHETAQQVWNGKYRIQSVKYVNQYNYYCCTLLDQEIRFCFLLGRTRYHGPCQLRVDRPVALCLSRHKIPLHGHGLHARYLIHSHSASPVN